MGDLDRRLAEHVDEVLLIRAKRRLRVEESAQFLNNLQIDSVPLQIGIVEQLHEGRECRVGIGQPQRQHFLQRNPTVGSPLGFPLHVIVQRDLSPVDSHRWVPIHESAQSFVDLFFSQLIGQRLQRVLHDFWTLLLAVQLDHVVQDFVDKAHSVDLAGAHCLLRKTHQISLLVHLPREDTRSVEIGEDNVPGHGEKLLVELVLVPCSTGNVKF
ncbi:MAG: hypothetical protein MAG451_01163 [Anaerolineales bacterium]|nr:hypothetical protein [Anaerolineales bacterium]